MDAPLALLHGVGDLESATVDEEGFVVRSLASTVRYFGGRLLLELLFPMPFMQSCKFKLFNRGLAGKPLS